MCCRLLLSTGILFERDYECEGTDFSYRLKSPGLRLLFCNLFILLIVMGNISNDYHQKKKNFFFFFFYIGVLLAVSTEQSFLSDKSSSSSSPVFVKYGCLRAF